MFKSVILNSKTIVIIFVFFAIAASTLSLGGTKIYEEGGKEYNRYNNYTIFQQSFLHLKEGKDPYIAYPEEHWDLFKYSPTFSVFFSVFALFPDWLGLNLWNILNALILVLAVYYLPKLKKEQKALVLLILLIELMTSMQNSQSNGLMAGLLVLGFGLLEKDKYLWGTLAIVFSVFIKLFGIVGFAIFLFYPQKWKLAMHAIFWILLLFVIPLILIDFNQYDIVLSSYWELLLNDHIVSDGFSVMGWINSWFGVEIIKWLVVLAGIIIFLIPLTRIKAYKDYRFRLLTLSSILIWVVIFNHKAESATFVIAMSGVSLWFINSPKNILNIVLMISAFVLTSLSPTDIFPNFLRENYVNVYTLKALPCILIWLKIIFDMTLINQHKEVEQLGEKEMNVRTAN
jgi:hypothetical protein